MSTNSDSKPGKDERPVSSAGRALVLTTAFLGWMFAGWQLAISPLAMRDASSDLLQDEFVAMGIAGDSEPSDEVIKKFDEDEDGKLSKDEKQSGRESIIGGWFGSLIASFLLGAALGGYVFGWFGDRFGRAKAMALSILWYSAFSAATVLVQDPWQLLAVRFITCMGIGGMWPNGIALVSEAWPGISRPILAGAIGTAANVGILILNYIGTLKDITSDDWHWIMYLGASPFLLGLIVWFFVPESPKWLALRDGEDDESDQEDESENEEANDDGEKVQTEPTSSPATSLIEIFKPPILWITLLGIGLGTIPLFGGWGSSNWGMAWASKVGEDIGDPGLKARLGVARSLPGMVTSLLGGYLAMLIGRRKFYFIVSLGAFISAQVLFRMVTPHNEFQFTIWFGALGFFSGFFFGWLPLCLPELFPTRVRSTGAGVSFNWGRILTALGVIFAGVLLKHFKGDYSQIGIITSFIYAFGLVIVFLIPEKSGEELDD